MIENCVENKGIELNIDSDDFQENVKKEKIERALIFKIIFFAICSTICFLPYKPIVIRNNINSPFSFNIGNEGNISEPNLDIFNLKEKDFSANRIKDDKYSSLENFTNLNELNASRWIDLTDEIKDKLKDNNNLNNINNKKYFLASFVFRKTEMNILNRKELKVKEKYQNKLREIEKLDNKADKNKEINKILDKIGFYVPNKVYFGGRIDISYEQNINDKDLVQSDLDKIFNFSSNSFLKKIGKYKSYYCQVFGGEKKFFLKEKNISKWYESITIQNSEIISYENLETINNFFDKDLKDKFLKEYQLYKEYQFSDGKYYGDLRNKKRNGYGKFEYNNGNTYTGEWKDNKRDGEGSLYEKEFLRYTGDWKNDLYDGIGQLYSSKSKTSWIKAEFKNGKCQKIIELSSKWHFYEYVWCKFD